MTKVVIGIHGLANKPARPVHREGWIKSLHEGLAKNTAHVPPPIYTLEVERFCDVYWADLMYPAPRDVEPYVEAKAGGLKVYKDKYLDDLRAQLQGGLGWVVDKVKGTLGFDTLADAVLDAKLKDLAFYYDDARTVADRNAEQRKARDVLQEELINAMMPHKGKDILLIGHSMGSIIAYDVLRRLGQEDSSWRVNHLVTLGSPLGLPHVKLKAREFFEAGVYGDARLRTPSIVSGSWVNFADPKDPVAFDTHLGDDFESNAGGVRVSDALVLNDYEWNGKANHHKIFGYLRAPEFSRHLNQFLADRL